MTTPDFFKIDIELRLELDSFYKFLAKEGSTDIWKTYPYVSKNGGTVVVCVHTDPANATRLKLMYDQT